MKRGERAADRTNFAHLRAASRVADERVAAGDDDALNSRPRVGVQVELGIVDADDARRHEVEALELLKQLATNADYHLHRLRRERELAAHCRRFVGRIAIRVDVERADEHQMIAVVEAAEMVACVENCVSLVAHRQQERLTIRERRDERDDRLEAAQSDAEEEKTS